MSWKNKQSTYTQTETAQLARIRWNHGRRVGRVGTAGVFYAKEQAFTSAPDGWRVSELYSDGGWESDTLQMVPLLKRSQPFTTDASGTAVWHAHWQANANMRIYTEVLAMIAGYDDPVIFTAKGWTGQRVAGAKRSVMSDHIDYVWKPAQSLGATLPPWAFWCTVAGAVDVKNQPLFIEVGGAQKVVLQDLTLHGITAPCTEKQIDALYIGDDLYDRVNAIREQYIAEKWQDQKRGNVVADVSDTPAAAATDEFDAY